MSTATAVGCPDCRAPGSDRLHYHEQTCPLHVASRRRAAWDLGWLTEHADETDRYRPVVPSERDELRALGVPIRRDQSAHALVTAADDGAVVSVIVLDGRATATLVVFPT